MNSPRKFSYEVRPVKFVERKMLLSSLLNVCNFYPGQYQYVGFGGVNFTDFKLFHKELHIDVMTSIEGGNLMKRERIDFNNPYSCIKIEYGLSTSALSRIKFVDKSIVWLDYDGDLAQYMFDDIDLLFRVLPQGSVYIITCNRQLKDRATSQVFEVKKFLELFKDYAPFDLAPKDLAASNSHITIRKMILKAISKAIKSRPEKDYSFFQLFNFLYEEEGGAKMFSFGGVIEKENFQTKNYQFNDETIIRTSEEPLRLSVPVITRREAEYINLNLNDLSRIYSSKILEGHLVDKYKEVYKYLPTFLDVRL